ncbi:MAG: hypothetical protein FWD68_19635 [Alphaproteobacteria bacterium]|nr:hypothetical protein [Alphaproteobacteria bacterium]
MADYYPLIARAITALDPSAPGESRRVIYERARTALIAQLRGVQPPLSDSEIIRERLALEEAVRKVEAEAAQRTRDAVRQGGPRPAPRGAESSSPQSGGGQPEGRSQPAYPPRGEPQPPPRRSQPPPASKPSASRSFRDAPGDAEDVGYLQSQGGRSTRRSYANAPPPEQEPPQRSSRREGRKPYADQPIHEDEYDARLDMEGRGRSGFPFKILITLAVLLILVPIVGYLWGKPYWESWQQSSQVDPQHPPKLPEKEGERLGEPAVQQRAVLLLEEDQKAKKIPGTVIWRFEPGNNPSEGVVRAVVDFPERKLKVQLTLQRNTEPALPASHTAELSFITPPDSPNGGVEGMANIVMKTNEDELGGVSLAGSVVNVTGGLFLVGLTESMRAGNLQLLRDRAWFEIPITFTNKQRALISIEKGASGVAVLNEAFAKWGD